MKIKEFLLKGNNNLDLLRVVCATMVIIGHSYRLNFQQGQEDVIRMLTGFTYSGALAVKLFFFISGMLVTDSILKRGSIPVFIVSRLFRIMPALLVLLLLSAFVIGPIVSEFPLPVYFRSLEPYKYIASNIVFLTSYFLPGVFLHNDAVGTVNGSLWSLRLEIRCYIFLLLSFALVKTRKYAFNILILFVFIDAVFNLQIIGHGDSPEHRLLPVTFAFGALMAVNKERIPISIPIALSLIIFTALLWKTQFNELMFTFSCCYLSLLFCKNKYVMKFKLRYDISYGIYLWGWLVQQMLFLFAGRQNVYLFMVEAIIISCILGYLSYILIEKPAMNIGKNISKRFDSKSVSTNIGRIPL